MGMKGNPMKYAIILNGELHKKFKTIRALAEYLVYSDITQGVHRSVHFYGNKCEITTYGKIK